MSEATQKTQRREEITCYFCRTPESVFSKTVNGETTWDCRECKAHFFQKMKHGQKSKITRVIQDYAAMYDDSSMGCHVVFTIQGDISRRTASTLREGRDLKSREGFNDLSKDFGELLWSNSDGKPVLTFEVIEEACRKHAYTFTASNDSEKIAQLSLCHIITAGISKTTLAMIHELVDSIPKSNDNLIRYFVAEGQEDLIIKAVRRAHDKFVTKGNELGIKMTKAMCA